jgi:hypothetical protein
MPRQIFFTQALLAGSDWVQNENRRYCDTPWGRVYQDSDGNYLLVRGGKEISLTEDYGQMFLEVEPNHLVGLLPVTRYEGPLDYLSYRFKNFGWVILIPIYFVALAAEFGGLSRLWVAGTAVTGLSLIAMTDRGDTGIVGMLKAILIGIGAYFGLVVASLAIQSGLQFLDFLLGLKGMPTWIGGE